MSVAAAPMIPRAALWAAVALLGALVIGVAGLRGSGWRPAVAPGAPLIERQLRFEDLPDGGIRITDAARSLELERLHGEQGFLRGVLRGLARERRARGLAETRTPFELSLRDDGRLLLADPATGRRIDLASFGPDNAAVFARWLPARPGARP